jgi:uncharacterized membrane protein YtjA (UPF0391 family)
VNHRHIIFAFHLIHYKPFCVLYWYYRGEEKTIPEQFYFYENQHGKDLSVEQIPQKVRLFSLFKLRHNLIENGTILWVLWLKNLLTIKPFFMLRWTLIFLVIAVIAAIFGFGGIAAGAASIAKILFYIFLVLFVLSLIAGGFRRVD